MKVKDFIAMFKKFDQEKDVKIVDVGSEPFEILAVGIENPLNDEPFVFVRVEE